MKLVHRTEGRVDRLGKKRLAVGHYVALIIVHSVFFSTQRRTELLPKSVHLSRAKKFSSRSRVLYQTRTKTSVRR